MPDTKLLSNGTYHVMITPSGGGYSRWKALAVTRWREDATLDNWGAFCYLRDCADSAVWSTTLQPTLQRPDASDHSFDTGTVTFSRRDHEIETHTQIAVSSEDDVELRRVRITNLSDRRRTLSATSFAEIVLAAAATDSAHPAFSKLFIQTEIDPVLHTIFATRRPSAIDDPTPWFFHLAVASDSSGGQVSYETDRMRFIGRGRSTVAPAAMRDGDTLSGSAGPVLDAVAAIRVPFTLEAGASFTIDWITGVASSRDACAALARKYRNVQSAQRILELADSYRQSTLQALHATDADALLYERMAASIIYAGAALRANAKMIEQNRRGQSGLWGFGISGDAPIVLLQVSDPERIDLVRQLVRAHAYWRRYGITTELVIIGAQSGNRAPTLFEQIRQTVDSGPEAASVDQPGGVFVRDSAQLDSGDRMLLQSVARVVLDDAAGTLVEQLDKHKVAAAITHVPPVAADLADSPVSAPSATSHPQRSDLLA
ncbi:MAG: cyclic beta 1-2 glucan synthetase, partial [Betaproteobacteria bacterium]